MELHINVSPRCLSGGKDKSIYIRSIFHEVMLCNVGSISHGSSICTLLITSYHLLWACYVS